MDIAITIGLAVALVSVSPPFPGPFDERVFNTGVDDDGLRARIGSCDLHWYVVSSPADPAYLAEAPDSSAISPDFCWIRAGEGARSGGTRTFRLVFDLTGRNPATARLSGLWASIGPGLLRLNGRTPPGLGTNALESADRPTSVEFRPFEFRNGFVEGLNRLDFEVEESEGPATLNVRCMALDSDDPPAGRPGGTPILGLASFGALFLAWSCRGFVAWCWRATVGANQGGWRQPRWGSSGTVRRPQSSARSCR